MAFNPERGMAEMPPQEKENSFEKSMEKIETRSSERLDKLRLWAKKLSKVIADNPAEEERLRKRLSSSEGSREVPEEYLLQWRKESPKTDDIDHYIRYAFHARPGSEGYEAIRGYMEKFDEIDEEKKQALLNLREEV